MENMDKNTLRKLVFGFTLIMFIIIFLLILSTKEQKNDDKDNYIENNINNSEEENESNVQEDENDNQSDENIVFDFQRIKLDTSCIDNLTCDFIIGTIKENDSTKLLGYKRLNNKHSILLEEKVIYEQESDFTINEFISFKDEYLVLVMAKEDNNSLVLLDKNGNKILSDEYIKSDIYLDEILTYKSLNCNDNMLYDTEIKIINGKPKIIVNFSSGEKSDEKCNL